MDIGLVQTEDGSFDIAISEMDLGTDSGLRTAVIVSLFTDARVDQTELPIGETDRGGYWADELSDDAGEEWGSKLWLLKRSKLTNNILTLAETYAADSLDWLLSEKIAKGVQVSASLLNSEALQLEISIERHDGREAKFTEVWKSA